MNCRWRQPPVDGLTVLKARRATHGSLVNAGIACGLHHSITQATLLASGLAENLHGSDPQRGTIPALKPADIAAKVRKISDFTHRTLASAANPPAQGSTNATALRYHTRLAGPGYFTRN